ncbi:MAG: ribbon-helix-helix domain-containing protein [Candidatus Firestonebacteria bacterium]
MGKHNTSVVLDEVLLKKLKVVSIKTERTKSWLISKAVEGFLEEIEDYEIAYERLHNENDKTISSKEFRKNIGI